MRIDFTLNGHPQKVECDPERRVIDLLREDFGLTGSKEACGSGECGACSVLVDGSSRLSCLMLACQLQGRNVTTVEGLSPEPSLLHPLQRAFINTGAVQCGYCSPGMLIAAADLLARQPHPTRQQIRSGLSGNLCRCTGYQKIVDAVAEASRDLPEGLTASRDEPVLAGEGGAAMLGDYAAAYEPSAATATSGFPLPGGMLTTGGSAGNVPAVSIIKCVQAFPGQSRLRVLQPASLDELLKVRVDCPEGIMMAGGTDVLVWMRTGRVQAKTLILTSGVPELRRMELDGSDLIIGAGMSLQDILDDSRISEGWPLLAHALEKVGSPPIRHMGTLAGNVCSASPAGDSLPALHILGATLEVASSRGIRREGIADFITGPGQNTLKEDECLLSIRIPRPCAGQIGGFVKVGQRKALAIAIASMAYSYRLDEKKRVHNMQLAWGSVGPVVMRFPDIEAGFEGRVLERKLLEEWSPYVAARVQPITDIRGAAEYRRLVAGRLLYKMLLPLDSEKK